MPELVEVEADVGLLGDLAADIGHVLRDLLVVAEAMLDEEPPPPPGEVVGVDEPVGRRRADGRLPALVHPLDLHLAGLLGLPLLEEQHGPVVYADPPHGLLALWCTQLLIVGPLLPNEDPLALEVDVLPHEAECLAAPHARGECEPHRDDSPVALLRAQVRGEPHRLLEREGVALASLLPRGVDVVAGVVRDEALSHGGLHDERERPVDVVDVGGRSVLSAEGVVCGVDHCGRHLVDEVSAEQLLDLPNVLGVALHGERREGVGLLTALEPPVRVLGERQLLEVGEPLLQLDAVELELAPCLSLVAVHSPPGRLDVLLGYRVPAYAMPDVVDLAADLFLDGSLSDYLGHGNLLTSPSLRLDHGLGS